jgi:hypothetical protein
VLISSAGRNDFIAAFLEGEPTALDAVCAALAYSESLVGARSTMPDGTVPLKPLMR